MDFDLDPFSDIVPEHAGSNARAGGKFQPKSKTRPKKGTPSTLPTSFTSATKEIPVITTSSNDAPAVKSVTPVSNLQDSIQSLSPVDPGMGGSINSIHVSVNNSIRRPCVMTVEDPSSELIGVEVLDKKTEASHSDVDGERILETMSSLSQVTVNKEDAGSTNAVFSETDVSDNDVNIHSGSGKLGGEAGDIFFELESLDNILFQANASTVGTENNLQCNIEASPQPENEGVICHPTSNVMDSNIPVRDHIIHSSNHQDSEEERCIQAYSSVNSSNFLQCDANATGVSLESVLPYESVNNKACDSSRHLQIGNLRSTTKEAEAFDGLETLDVISEATIGPDKNGGKSWSKSKAQDENEKLIPSLSIPNAMESISSPVDSPLTPQIYLNENSAPSFHPDGSLDFSTMRFSETVPSDHPPELMVTEGPINLVEASQPDVTSVTSEKVKNLQASGGTSKRGTRKKKQGAVENVDSQNFEQPSQRGQDQGPASTAVEENEASKSSRRLRKRKAVCVPAEEGENGIGESDNVHKEASHCSNLQGDEEGDDVEYRPTGTSQKRRAPRKLKKHAPENDEPVQTHKKSYEGHDPSEKELKKRFSHSTKRKRRIVDKVLLETPEDEINPQKLNFRDLILLAEAKEKLLNKEAAASKKSLPDRRASPNETDSTNEEGDEQVKRGTIKINYHTYMDRTPSERWSKQDTEQFYEAIRQFGTDFAMIQQLFPGRTRHQVKLKFKKEERQHPLRVSDALTNRSKDHSHFEIVIQRLQAAAQAEKSDSDVDVASVAVTDEEQEEVAKSEQKVEEEEEEEYNLDLKVPEVCDTAASPEKEDDFSIWCDYKGADYSP